MGSFDLTQQAEEENELRKKQEQALMEKLLEQEALMEQQDPKVRSAWPLRLSSWEGRPSWFLEASRKEGQKAGFAQEPHSFLLGLADVAHGFVIHYFVQHTVE